MGMNDLERAKLIPVSGNNNTPEMRNAIDVQFNPTSLKVTLSNTLKENGRNANSRASQYVDKSSSTLAVELIFDTTYIEAPAGGSAPSGQTGSTSPSNSRNRIEQGSDVRIQTKKIADAFVKPVGSGSRMRAPKRCQFQWGAFAFVGLVDSFEETLDFFSPKGRPLRATISLKLKEDRYQFLSKDRNALAAEQTPQLSFTGNGADRKQPGGGSGAGNGAPAPNQNTNPVPGTSGGPGSWRDNAMFNGIESPRLPSLPNLALPSVALSAGAGFGISGGVSVGLSAGLSMGITASASLSVDVSVSGTGKVTAQPGGAGSTATPKSSAPAFKFGNSTALGTGIPGAFHPDPGASLKASQLQLGNMKLRVEPTAVSSSGLPAPGATTARTTGTAPASRGEERGKHGISVTELLKKAADRGVGFD